MDAFTTSHFLDGGGDMAKAIAAHDWSDVGFGPPDAWPACLKTVVSITLNSRFPKCICWGPDLIAIYNDAFAPILGDKHPSALGRSFRDIWREAWDEIGPMADRALAGEATFIEDFPLEINRFGFPEQAHFTFCYGPIRDHTGQVLGMIDTVVETTGKIKAERQAEILNRELNHRMKNTFAIVSAIVSQTLRTAGSNSLARSLLTQRIAALANAQALLVSSAQTDANINDVLRQCLAPFDSQGRITISGPDVMVSSQQALTLALAANELATNAIKYGALSNGTGEVRLTWTAGRPHSQDAFHLSWRESGGPPVVLSTRKGFGSRILETVLATDFRGETTLTWSPSGIHCELKTQMRSLGA